MYIILVIPNMYNNLLLQGFEALFYKIIDVAEKLSRYITDAIGLFI